MRRILVTGAGGFVAGPLLDRLTGRAGVFRLARTPARGLIACDLADPAAAREAVRLARPDLVYHLAGAASAPDWKGLWRANVTTTINLLEALAAAGRPARVIIASSSGEYGTAGGVKLAKESSPLEPVTLYGSCKLAQTLAALSFNHGPLEVLAARIFNVIGPGTPENQAPGAFARQVARVAAGLQPPEIAVGDLSPRRDYVDVRDVAAALETIARHGRAGECYNVGSGRSVPMSAVLRGLAKAAGVRVTERIDPARFRRSEVQDIAADTRRLKALGWKPRISLARSLADTLAWWSAR